MKKIIALLLSALMLVGILAGCGGTDSSSAAPASDSTPAAAQETTAAAPEQPEAASAQEPGSAEESSTQEEVQVAAQNFDIPMPLTEEPVTFTYFMRFNPQVLIACILHACGNHGVRHFFDELFAHIASEFVPAVPSHELL